MYQEKDIQKVLEMNIENKKQQKTIQNTVVVPFYISKDKKDSKKSKKDADEDSDVNEDSDSEDAIEPGDTDKSENPFIQYFQNQGFFR